MRHLILSPVPIPVRLIEEDFNRRFFRNSSFKAKLKSLPYRNSVGSSRGNQTRIVHRRHNTVNQWRQVPSPSYPPHVVGSRRSKHRVVKRLKIDRCLGPIIWNRRKPIVIDDNFRRKAHIRFRSKLDAIIVRSRVKTDIVSRPQERSDGFSHAKGKIILFFRFQCQMQIILRGKALQTLTLTRIGSHRTGEQTKGTQDPAERYG